MAKDKYAIKRDERLVIKRSFLAEYFSTQEANRLNHIINQTGSPPACVFSLAGDTITRGVVDWFDTHDVIRLRQYFYVSALLMKHYYGMLNVNKLQVRKLEPFISQWELFAPLVSNQPELIQWYMQNDSLYDLNKIEYHKSIDFTAYQSVIALRGDWARLKARCELVLADPPINKNSTWHHYHALYYAMAKQDKLEMEQVLQEMLMPPKRSLLNEETPYTEHFFISRIIIFMKIAWLHGFEVQVDSPYVPMAWMPMTPNAHYDNYYSFLKL